mmetsp:Transcript_49251/g.60493  ORF Transcript_49251/g.60493 Transcript_49251/m.60493 type:complete len:297 (+) Transcript_49251:142-1032(+)
MTTEAEEQDYDEDMDMDDGNVFWTLTVKPNTETELPQPNIDGYIVHVTSATFGDKVKKGSRTVVNCTTFADDNEGITSPICVLRENTCETIQLDLLFSEMVSFKVSGKNASEVTLNGYLQPPFDNINAADLEDMEEAKIEEALKRQQGLKRQRSEMSSDDIPINGDTNADATDETQTKKDDDDDDEDNEIEDLRERFDEFSDNLYRLDQSKARRINDLTGESIELEDNYSNLTQYSYYIASLVYNAWMTNKEFLKEQYNFTIDSMWLSDIYLSQDPIQRLHSISRKIQECQYWYDK